MGVMLLAYTCERRSTWWILVFALACAASSAYGWLFGTWPFGVVEGVWSLVALRRWWLARRMATTPPTGLPTVALQPGNGLVQSGVGDGE